jgi:hypothetical protein
MAFQVNGRSHDRTEGTMPITYKLSTPEEQAAYRSPGAPATTLGISPVRSAFMRGVEVLHIDEQVANSRSG